MLARKTILTHPSGTSIETPLLIPSFSSKGFGQDHDGISEIQNIFEVASEYLSDCMLVSAYDLAYRHLKPIESAITEITIVDSGGYEISDLHDLSTVYHQTVASNEWDEEKLKNVYDEWPDHIPAIFVSYDHPGCPQSLDDQITNAATFLGNYPDQLHSILIKPETNEQKYVQISNIIDNVDKLKPFDVVGFTEKELGNRIIDRMKNLSKIRLAMDEKLLNHIPIHVFGSLDPITSVLYFLAGAEIFDGLTWLRYGYLEGAACYQFNYSCRVVGIDRTSDFVKGKVMADNVSYLLDLTNQMRKFLLDGDFSRFQFDSELFRQSYDLLRTRNGRVT